MAGFSDALGDHLRRRWLALVAGFVVVSLGLGCAGQRGYRQEALELLAEADEEDRRLATTSSTDALLLIAQARDARAGGHQLVRWTHHPIASVRSAAVHALGLVGDRKMASAMAAALSDQDVGVRSSAAFALSQHWSWLQTDLERITLASEIEQWLLEALQAQFGIPGLGPADEQRQELFFARTLLRALGEFQGAEGEEALFLATSHPPLRDAAQLALAVRGKNKRLEPLGVERLELLALGAGAGVAEWTLAYLIARAGVADNPVAQVLAESLLVTFAGASTRSPDGLHARAWSIRALGRLSASQALPRLLPLLAPDVPFRFRLNAVRAAADLGRSGSKVLLKALQDGDDRIQAEAAAALAAAKSEEGFAAVKGDLGVIPVGCDDPDLEWRLRALVGYAGSGAEQEERHTALLRLAEEALDCEGSDVRAAGTSLLAALPGEHVAERLRDLAETETDRVVRLEHALGVAARADELLEGLLLRWLSGPDPVFGAIAAEGLGKRRGAHVAASLLGAYESSQGPGDWERRLAIVEALVAQDELSDSRARAMASDSSAHVRRAIQQARLLAGGRKATRDLLPMPELASDVTDATWGVADVVGATVATDKGVIGLALYPQVAPATVASFVSLAESAAYEGLLFHRVVSDFVVQGGDPDGTGWGGPGYTLRDEFSAIPYRRGTLGMARAGLNTAGSQWFVTHSPQPHLDGHYTVFGQVDRGMDVVDSLRRGDRILSVEIRRRSP